MIIVRNLDFRDIPQAKNLSDVGDVGIICNIKSPEEDAFGIFVDGKLVGCCVLETAQHVDAGGDPYYNDDALLLTQVYVLPEYRHKGYALTMLALVLEQVEDVVYCEPENWSLIKLYGKVGFVFPTDKNGRLIVTPFLRRLPA